MKLRSITFLLTAALVLNASPAAATDEEDTNHLRSSHHDEDREHHRVLANNGKVPSFVTGNLGNVGVEVSRENAAALSQAAASRMSPIAREKLGVEGAPEFVPKGEPFFTEGKAHIRLANVVSGMEVEGAAVMVHVEEEDGTISAVNGEIVTANSDDDDGTQGPPADQSGLLPPQQALDAALEKAGLHDKQGEWQGGPAKLTMVRTSANQPCLSWKRALFYETLGEDGYPKPHRDEVYADARTGYPCAVFPRIYGDRSLDTKDCLETTNNCGTVSTSSNLINTGDAAIDAAHNYAIATYDYYYNNHGRDSIDGAGMTLISRVHYGSNYNNAFWDGTQMTYGDGDGTTFIPLSRDADVVAHELTHGVTERTSGLIYQYDSGALNEAMSDIFGAMVDAQVGAAGLDIWKIGEDVYTPGTPGDALRYMYDPELGGDYDWWPTRYCGSSDNGGVHWNSGIANLAFYLLSQGGPHPRGKSSVIVDGIGMETAADIFYEANVGCLTPSSNFVSARYCTADVMFIDADTRAQVHLAWDAVGVPANNNPAQPTIGLFDGVPLGNQYGSTGDVQHYSLSPVASGESVTCITSGNNGDADLYLRFGAEAEPNPSSSNNECGSYSSNSNEECSTGPASSDTTLYAAVHAWSCYSDLTITCTISGGGGGGGPCLPKGDSCSFDSECCDNKCRGKRGSKTCK